jgi:glucosamine-6-phosphate deaminase
LKTAISLKAFEDIMRKNRLTWEEMLRVPVEQLNEYSFVPVRILPDAEALFEYLARYTADIIRDHMGDPTPLRIVWPCGPKRHYPLLADICNRERISWHNTINIQMDEWLDWQGHLLPDTHPFNLQSYLRRNLFNCIDSDLRPTGDQMIFHDPLNLHKMDETLDKLGSIDLVFGGFGFTGHFAYNEPPTSRWTQISNEVFCSSRTHIVPTNDETFIMHAHRSTGGNTRLVPPMGVTLGMKDLLAAKTIRLVSDGGAWKQTIFRILCMHEPTVKYPCTFVQGHPDIEVIVDAKTAACPSSTFDN